MKMKPGMMSDTEEDSEVVEPAKNAMRDAGMATDGRSLKQDATNSMGAIDGSSDDMDKCKATQVKTGK